MATFIELTSLNGEKVNVNMDSVFYHKVQSGINVLVKDLFIDVKSREVTINEVHVQESWDTIKAIMDLKTPRKSCCR